MVPFPWKNGEIRNEPSPDKKKQIIVIEKYTIDPPNQMIYLQSNNSRELLAYLEEDNDWVETISWLSDERIKIVTDKYNFSYSLANKILIRKLK